MIERFLTNRYVFWVAVVVIFTAGFSAFGSLPRQEDPRITTRNATIITPFPGASARRVETLVTEVLEDELQDVPEIKHIESTSRPGLSTLTVELNESIGPDENGDVFSEIRSKLKDAEPDLPAEASRPEFDDKRGAVAFTLIASIRWNQPGEPDLNIMNRWARELADRLRTVGNTELVRLYGEPDEELTVRMDPNRTRTTGLDPAAVARKIAGADPKIPGGNFRRSTSDVPLEVSGEIQSLNRVREIPLTVQSNGSALTVGDVADVSMETRTPPREIGLDNGARSILVAARMQRNKRIDQWSEKANAVIDSVRRSIGKGIELNVVFDQNHYTEKRLSSLAGNLLAGALVVMFVVLILMGWRRSLIVGAALPLVASIVLFGLLIFDAALHQISIFGMIIALGLLIDNAIVIVDEIRKNLRDGADNREALRNTLTHLYAPLGASTLTTVFGFAPILLLPGNAGDFVGWIGGSVILAILASYAVSLTLIATLAVLYGDSDESSHETKWWKSGLSSSFLLSGYRRFLGWCLRYPFPALALAVALPVAGFVSAPFLGSQFFPPIDRNMFDLQVWMPRETGIQETRSRVESMEEVIREFDKVEDVHWLVGGSFPSVYYNLIMNMDRASYYAQGVVVTDNKEGVPQLIAAVQNELDRRFPQSQMQVRRFKQGPPVDADVEYRLTGPSVKRLQKLGKEVRKLLQADDAVLMTRTTLPGGLPKLDFNADENLIRRVDLSQVDLANRLRSNLEGNTGGSLLDKREELEVRTRYSNSYRKRFERLKSSYLTRPGGPPIPLSGVGQWQLRPELGGITHYDGIRNNTIQGYVERGALPINVTMNVLEEIKNKLFPLPEGYNFQLGGDVEQDREARGNLAAYAPVLMMLMVASLILSFRSLRMAGILVCVALLTVGLGILSMAIIAFPISFNTILSTIGLIGVGINDSIVIMAAIRSNPEARNGDHGAIVHEVVDGTRHVLSTTFTTMGGFLPLLVFVGGYFWTSLSIVFVFGILGTTVLALIFVPSAYVIVRNGVRT